jgi:O-succinylbenzoic acid--CoA ligase
MADGESREPKGWLMIPSGGSGGRVKFARHDEDTLSAAVRGFCGHFRVERVNGVGVLPLHHVSGLMACLRCALTGGEYIAWDWKKLEKGLRPPLPRERAPGGWFISLVPTQLQRLLAEPEALTWLRTFDAVCVGGGPIWAELADAAAHEGVPVSPGYGMTETAAMVAALLPEKFLEGGRGCGSPMPHAKITLAKGGAVEVEGDSVFRGYFPERRPARRFTTEDLGAFDERGGLHLLGRRDLVIITGGKKVDPHEVEAALMASGEFQDVAVVGVPDAEWGHRVVACYPAGRPDFDRSKVERSLAFLASFKRPREFRAVPDWPRNAQGKLNRPALAARLG